MRQRVGPAGRRELEKWGHDDGIAVTPDPSINLLTTTPRREQLAQEHLAAELDAELAFARRKEELLQKRMELIHSIDAWQAEIARIVDDLARIHQSTTAADGRPLRRSSEKDRSDEFVRYRRDRENRQAVQQLKRRRETLRQQVDDTNHAVGRLNAALDDTASQREFFLRWIREQYRLAIAIYDTALLRHHPARDLIQPLRELLAGPADTATAEEDKAAPTITSARPVEAEHA